jgi:hypothetical protein
LTDTARAGETQAEDLMMILDGGDLDSVRRQRRYERQPAWIGRHGVFP